MPVRHVVYRRYEMDGKASGTFTYLYVDGVDPRRERAQPSDLGTPELHPSYLGMRPSCLGTAVHPSKTAPEL